MSEGAGAPDAADHPLFESLLAELAARLETLADKPEETVESTLRALWHFACGRRVSAALATSLPLPALDDEARHVLRDAVAKRLAGVPLAHLTGRQQFMGLEMIAGREALIPRRETELLARTAIGLLDPPGRGPIVVDVCTGGANVAAAIGSARPDARLLASDVSDEAVALARRNLAHLGLADRVRVVQGDLFGAPDVTALAGGIDLITCNPPYISTPRRLALPAEIAQHEPAPAFDGGALGIAILQRLVREAPPLLRPGGWLAFEVGAGQGASVGRRLEAGGLFDRIDPVRNEHGEIRVIAARRSSPS